MRYLAHKIESIQEEQTLKEHLQNAVVFRKILGEENVLENHSNVDYESSVVTWMMLVCRLLWNMEMLFGSDERGMPGLGIPLSVTK